MKAKKELNALKSVIDLAAKTNIIEPKTYFATPKLYPSSFPYCGLRDLYETMSNKLDPHDISKTHDELEGPLTYYGNTGTVLHDVLQKWLGRLSTLSPDETDAMDVKVEFIGNWECPKCKKTRLLSTYKDCNKCGGATRYKELYIKVGCVSSKLDGLLKFTIAGKSSYWIIDYKTTNTSKVWKHRKQGGIFPQKSNIEQIEFYASFFEQEYDIKIKGWILAYFARDAPFFTYELVCDTMSKSDKEMCVKKVTRYMKLFDLVRKIELGKKGVQAVKKVIKYKPCKNKTFYMDNYHNMYDMCPLSVDSKCFKPELEKNIIKLFRKFKKESK